jgi:hypothetical protein
MDNRDLKLGNIVLDKRNQSVTITNFCLGKHLMNDKVTWPPPTMKNHVITTFSSADTYNVI